MWTDPLRKEACKGCRKAAKQRNHPPRCRGCQWNPELYPGNYTAMEFWDHIRTQWRAGGFGLVGLDYPAVRSEARELNLYLSHGLMRKIQALERFELERKPKDEHCG